ncbi:hypothetical protein BGW39_011135 [Mortierella sp. 14UC]|nr:hypothetical protein BGW39_011135 [Mortierella sp. 14UC]
MALQPSAGDYTIRNAIASVHTGAQMTSPERHRLARLKMSASKAFRSFGKKGDPTNILATGSVEQTRIWNPVDRFFSDEPTIDDSGQDEDIVVLDRGNGPNPSTAPRQDTASRKNMAAH